MSKHNYDIFISYRKRCSGDKPEMLQLMLEESGFRKRVSFDKDNLNIIRNNGIKIPRKVVIIGKAKRPIYLFKQFVKKNNFIRTIYFKIKKADYNDELVKIQRYNTDKEFAKKCDSGII